MTPYIRIFSGTIPSYGLSIALACALVGGLSLFRARKHPGMGDGVLVILACAGGLALISAKLLYWAVSMPWGELVRLVRTGQLSALFSGGQVFYGGAAGGALGALLGLRLLGEKADGYLRVILPTLPFGHALGRVGCLLAGCCYGIPYEGLGAIRYHEAPGGAPLETGLFPVQALEALALCQIGVLLLVLSRGGTRGELLIWVYGLLYALARFGLEFLRGDAVRGGLWVFSTSQWISLILFTGSLLMLILPWPSSPEATSEIDTPA